MNSIIEIAQNFASTVGFIPSLIILALLGMYIFWSESHSTRKDRNSVFDIYILILLVTVIWGRLSYIISTPSEFDGLIWSLAPYEKYSDGVYFFRLLPWKFFKIWDGGFQFVSMYSAFTIFGFLVSTYIKKWRWREMIGVITVTATLMLSLSIIVTGLLGESNLLVRQGIGILTIYVLYFVLSFIFKSKFGKREGVYEKGSYIISFLYFIVSNIYISYTLLLSDITLFDQYNVYAIIIYIIVASLTFFTDMQRKSIIIDTVTRALKLPKVGTTIKVNRKK